VDRIDLPLVGAAHDADFPRPVTARPGPPVVDHCTAEVCITCSDAAVAVTVLEVRRGELALVDTGVGEPEEVSIALVDAGVGDVVLVHAGEAIAVVAPEPAASPSRTAPAATAPPSVDGVAP
jgi:hydrogenase maturation factor